MSNQQISFSVSHEYIENEFSYRLSILQWYAYSTNQVDFCIPLVSLWDRKYNDSSPTKHIDHLTTE